MTEPNTPEPVRMPLGSLRIAPDAENLDVIHVTDHRGRTWRIHRQDADPEHRFTAYRLAAGWFGNLPGDHPRAKEMAFPPHG